MFQNLISQKSSVLKCKELSQNVRAGLRSFCKRKSAFDQYYCWILRSLKTQFCPLINQSKSPFVAPKPFDKLIATKTTKKQHLAQVQFNNKFPNPNTQKIYKKFPNQLRKKKIPCRSGFLKMQNKKKKKSKYSKIFPYAVSSFRLLCSDPNYSQ